MPQLALARRGRPSRARPSIFDIDGVLSDAAGRQHFLEWGRRDWDAFFDACGEDPLIDEVARLLELLDPELRIVLLTGRPAAGPAPDAGLAGPLPAAVGPARHARPRRLRPGVAVQARRWWPSSGPTGFDPRLAFEDDPRNRDMFHSEGIPCIYIHSGYYE